MLYLVRNLLTTQPPLIELDIAKVELFKKNGILKFSFYSFMLTEIMTCIVAINSFTNII